jgi:hypothetical protein
LLIAASAPADRPAHVHDAAKRARYFGSLDREFWCSWVSLGHGLGSFRQGVPGDAKEKFTRRD